MRGSRTRGPHHIKASRGDRAPGGAADPVSTGLLGLVEAGVGRGDRGLVVHAGAEHGDPGRYGDGERDVGAVDRRALDGGAHRVDEGDGARGRVAGQEQLFKIASHKISPILGDGKIRYHMVYIDDLIHAYLLAAEVEAAVGEAFIIGGDEALELNELLKTIGRVLDKPIRIFRI